MSELRPQKIGVTVPVSREMAIIYGLVEPTDAERAAMDAESAKWTAWKQRQDARQARGLASLREVAGPLVRRLLDLHAADDRGECLGCDSSGYEAERPEWPCRTVDAIAEHHGIEMEEPMP